MNNYYKDIEKVVMMRKQEIDFVKWEFEKAGEPFKVNVYPNCTTVDYPSREHAIFIEDFDKTCPDYVKSLLLQKAIEGVNDTQRKYDIRYINNTIKIFDDEEHELLADYWRTVDIDQAKESALKYIHEQESK